MKVILLFGELGQGDAWCRNNEIGREGDVICRFGIPVAWFHSFRARSCRSVLRPKRAPCAIVVLVF